VPCLYLFIYLFPTLLFFFSLSFFFLFFFYILFFYFSFFFLFFFLFFFSFFFFFFFFSFFFLFYFFFFFIFFFFFFFFFSIFLISFCCYLNRARVPTKWNVKFDYILSILVNLYPRQNVRYYITIEIVVHRSLHDRVQMKIRHIYYLPCTSWPFASVRK